MQRRIAYVIHTFQKGGLERCLANLVNHLDRSRFLPYIFCLNRSGDATNWLKVADVPILELHKRPGNDVRAVYHLSQLCNKHAIDLVHSHNWCTLVETVAARKWAGVPRHVHAQHGMDVGFLDLRGWHGRMQKEAVRWSLRLAEATVAIAEPVRQFLRKQFQVPQARLHLVLNGIELPNREAVAGGRHAIRQRLGIQEEALVLGSVGRLAPVKGFDLAIDALTLLAARGHDVHLLLVGDGPEKDRLAQYAVSRNVSDRVHLAGGQDNVPAWLGAMDIFLNTSHSEGMSLAILEGMAAGLPMAVADAGANASLVNGPAPGGVVIRPRTAEAFAEALEGLIRRPELRQELGQRGQLRAAPYDVHNMVRAYERLYLRLLPR
jgi:glycosyltransferase involved in cell wall biosynthesis